MALPPLPPARPGELRECYYNLAERGTCSLLATNTSQQECCCTVGEGWGLGCQYHACPSVDSGEGHVRHLTLLTQFIKVGCKVPNMDIADEDQLGD